MSFTIQALEAEALQVPETDRVRLIERLIASLDADHDVEEAWAAEIERRNAQVESEKVSLRPGPQNVGQAEGRISMRYSLHPKAEEALRGGGGSALLRASGCQPFAVLVHRV